MEVNKYRTVNNIGIAKKGDIGTIKDNSFCYNYMVLSPELTKLLVAEKQLVPVANDEYYF